MVTLGHGIDEALDAAGYTVQRELGRGGMGVVLLAVQRSLNRLVALKLLLEDALADPSLRRRFESEGRLLRDLTHPNLVRLYDFHPGPPVPYLVLEFIPDARPLDERMRAQPPAPVAALKVARGILAALVELHQSGIVHRDLKPANVLVAPDGEPRVIDMGLARRLVADETRQTAAGMTVGTLSYMAPEQATGGEVGPAADVYAWGLIALELCAGRPLFSPAAGDRCIGPPVRLRLGLPPLEQFVPEVNPALYPLLARCTAHEPAARPPAEEIAGELAGTAGPRRPRPSGRARTLATPAASGTAGSGAAGSGGSTGSSSAPRGRGWIAVAALGAVVAVGAGILALAPRPRAEPVPGPSPLPSPTASADPHEPIRHLAAVLATFAPDAVLRRADTPKPTVPKLSPSLLQAVDRAAASAPAFFRHPFDAGLRASLLRRSYELEVVDAWLERRKLPRIGIGDRLLPPGWLEKLFHYDDPARPHRHAPGRVVYDGPAHQTLDGVPLKGGHTGSEDGRWCVFAPVGLSGGNAPANAMDDLIGGRPAPKSLPFSRTSWSLAFNVDPAALAAARSALLSVNTSELNRTVVWITLNDGPRIPFCRPVRPGTPDPSEHHERVRGIPVEVLRPGANTARIVAEPYPGVGRTSTFYMGLFTIQLDRR